MGAATVESDELAHLTSTGHLTSGGKMVASVFMLEFQNHFPYLVLNRCSIKQSNISFGLVGFISIFKSLIGV